MARQYNRHLPSRTAPLDKDALPNSRLWENKTSGLEALLPWADRYRYWLLGVGLLVYLAGYSPQWRIGPDSGGYLLIARSIALGEGFVHPTGLEADLPPGFPYLASVPLSIFGPDAFWAVNVLMLAIGLVTLGLSFWLYHLHAGRPTAVVVTTLLAIGESFYTYCFEILADGPFATGMIMMLVGLERFHQKRPRPAFSVALVGLGILVMALTRNVVITALAATVLGLAWQLVRQRRFGVLAWILGVGVVGFGLLRLVTEGHLGLNQDEQILLSRLTDRLPETMQGLGYNLYLLFCENFSRAALGSDFGPWVNGALGVLVFGACISLIRVRPVWGLLFLVFCVQWLIFLVTRRYFLPLLPLLAYGCWNACLQVDRRYYWRPPGFFVALFLFTWVLMNGLRVVQRIQEQHHPRFVEVHEDGRYVGLDEMASFLQESLPADSRILASPTHCAPLMLMTDQVLHDYPRRALIEAETVYVITPLQDDANAAIQSLGWSLAQPMVEIARSESLEPLQVRSRTTGAVK